MEFHALRSLAWTLNEMAFRQGRSLSDFSYAELLNAGDQIQESNYLNYLENSYSPGFAPSEDRLSHTLSFTAALWTRCALIQPSTAVRKRSRSTPSLSWYNWAMFEVAGYFI